MTKLKRCERVVEREIDGDLVLYDPQTDSTFLLNRVSAAIWDLCDGERSAEDIAREIAGAYTGRETDEVLRDTREALDQLRSEHIVAECVGASVEEADE